jgi:hypothetical protein
MTTNTEIKIENLETTPSTNPEFKWVRVDLNEQNLKIVNATKSSGNKLISRVYLDQNAIYILVPKDAEKILFSESLNLVQVVVPKP